MPDDLRVSLNSAPRRCQACGEQHESGEPCIAEVCGETFDHDLLVVGVRDGIRTYECRRCGAEVFTDEDEYL